MGLEFKMKNMNLLDDLEEELSKKLNIKITFDNYEKEDNNIKKDKENIEE